MKKKIDISKNEADKNLIKNLRYTSEDYKEKYILSLPIEVKLIDDNSEIGSIIEKCLC